MFSISSSSRSSVSVEDLDLECFSYPIEEMPSTLPLPPEQLQTLMEYLPCAFDQYAMRSLSKEWCREVTNFIQHQNTVSVEDARTFLKTAIDPLKAKSEPSIPELVAIEKLELLSEELEDILNSQRLFGPRRYIEVIDRFDKIIHSYLRQETRESLKKEISEIPKSKMVNFYNQILKSGTNHNDFFWDKSLKKQKEAESCVLDLAKVGYTSDASWAACLVCSLWYNNKAFSCPSFGVMAHQQLLQGDIYGAHKTLNQGDSVRSPLLGEFAAAVDHARKEFYIQLISYQFNEIAIELSQTPKTDQKFITHAANALIHAFIECGQLRQAFDLVLDSERLWGIDPENMKREYANKIIDACVAPEDPSEENLDLALKVAEASGSKLDSGSMLFKYWAPTEVEEKRRNI